MSNLKSPFQGFLEHLKLTHSRSIKKLKTEEILEKFQENHQKSSSFCAKLAKKAQSCSMQGKAKGLMLI